MKSLNGRLEGTEQKLSDEKFGRSQDKIQMERKIKNLQGQNRSTFFIVSSKNYNSFQFIINNGKI